MQARHTRRGPARLEPVRAAEHPSSEHRPRSRQNIGTLERHPADGAIMSADAGALTTPLRRPGSEREAAITFRSILFPPDAEGLPTETADEPEFFRDLNLDKIVAAVTAGKDDYNLQPFLYRPIGDLATLEYRHEVMRDLEHDRILPMFRSFAEGMRSARQHLALSDKLHYTYQKKLWFLDAVATYCRTVAALAQDFGAANVQSQGLVAFGRYLIDYLNSAGFTALVAETDKLKADLATVKYTMLIKGDKITVKKYEDTPDYSVVVERTFDRFQQGAVKDYLVKFANGLDMNHVEAGVLGFVANLYPEIFSYLDDYVGRNQGFIDPTIGRFDREVQFYVSYLEHITVLKGHGLRFCYPKLSDSSKKVASRDGFDLALAHQLTAEKSPVVCNDFDLEGSERILVVSGPNQGGKTTFARTFGQLHYLASLGCPVPGTRAELFLFDRLFAHFERPEDITTLRGKLEDDLFRIHNILAAATPNSLIIMNEIFNSTTLRDAIFLGTRVLESIMDLDALAVCVTFIDELACLSDKTVSMVSTVVPENPAIRTFKIVRRPADGLAYAMSIAAKYGLTYGRLRGRIRS
jgi:DNA mismatch repair protein MutS